METLMNIKDFSLSFIVRGQTVVVKLLIAAVLLNFIGCGAFSDSQGPEYVAPKLEGKSHKDKVQIQKKIIEEQEEEIKKQKSEYEDIERQKYYNKRMKQRSVDQ
jgi:hypothetical protein